MTEHFQHVPQQADTILLGLPFLILAELACGVWLTQHFTRIRQGTYLYCTEYVVKVKNFKKISALPPLP